MCMLYAQDGPDVMEAVALDWEKIGIKVKRVPEATSAASGPRAGCARRTRRSRSTARRPSTSRSLGWERVIHSKGAFNLLLDGAYDEDIDAAMREFDTERRAKLTHALGQKLYDGYHGVMLGMKSITWALARGWTRGRRWPTSRRDQLRVRELSAG